MGGEDYEGRREARPRAVLHRRGRRRGRPGPVEYPVHGQSKADRSYLHFNEVEVLGTTEEVPVLVVPYDTAIEFDLASADVVHSFWVPEFLFKRDAFPHPEANKSNRRFQIEEISSAMIENRPVDNPRDSYSNAFVGRCAEMCGTYHAMMNFEIRAVSREAFAEYMQFRLDNPEATNAEALEAIGEDPFAVSTSPFNAGRLDTRDMGDREANTVDLNQ